MDKSGLFSVWEPGFEDYFDMLYFLCCFLICLLSPFQNLLLNFFSFSKSNSSQVALSSKSDSANLAGLLI